MCATTTITSKKVCVHFGLCGGCSWQNLSYDEQLQKKESFVRETLKDFPIENFLPIQASPEIFYYRNKMEFSFGNDWDRKYCHSRGGGNLVCQPLVENSGFPIEIRQGTDSPWRTFGNDAVSNNFFSNVHLGLHPKGRFGVVVPTPECQLLSEEANAILRVVSTWATERCLPSYVRSKNQGVLRHLVLREGKNTGERLVNLVATSELTAPDAAHLSDLSGRLQQCGVPITSVIWTEHNGLSDVARGEREHVLWGDGWIHENVVDVNIRVSPQTFMQTNTHASENMIRLLKEWAGVGDTLLDLYCGTGAIGLNLAGHFIHVIGVELEKVSIESARHTAQINRAINFTGHHGRTEELLSLFAAHRGQVDVCVVDPPRTGLHPKVGSALTDSRIPLLLYISCNPVSLARDLKELTKSYQIETVQPMDFFPHTEHVETAVKLAIR